jgi:hypothetical protein
MDSLKGKSKYATGDFWRAWAIVRVSRLTDGPRTGEIQVGYVGKGIESRINRADLADFMLQQLEEHAYLRKAPVISN